MLRTIICFAALVLVSVNQSKAGEPPLNNMNLLPGYVHVKLQGIDTIVGRIEKKGGLVIDYTKGRVAAPGGLSLGGDYQDITQSFLKTKENVSWYHEQTINNEEVHLLYTKSSKLYASWPGKGMNFIVEAKTTEEVAEALIMILSYP